MIVQNVSGYDDAVVLGHDWGGIATWVHALHYPQSVKRLIICNIPHPAAFVHLLKNDPRQKASSWYVNKLVNVYHLCFEAGIQRLSEIEPYPSLSCSAQCDHFECFRHPY